MTRRSCWQRQVKGASLWGFKSCCGGVERLCKRAADEKLLPAVFFVWSVSAEDLLAAPGMAAQPEPPAAPQGRAGWCCFFGCFAGKLEVCPSTAGGEKMPSDLRAALTTCRLDGHCIPWASQVWPGRSQPGSPAHQRSLLALPHIVVPVMSAGKEPGAGWFCSPAPSLLLGVELTGYRCQIIYIIPSKP